MGHIAVLENVYTALTCKLDITILTTIYTIDSAVRCRALCARIASAWLAGHALVNACLTAHVNNIPIFLMLRKHWVQWGYCGSCWNAMHVENVAHAVPLFETKRCEGSESITYERNIYAQMCLCGNEYCSFPVPAFTAYCNTIKDANKNILED